MSCQSLAFFLLCLLFSVHSFAQAFFFQTSRARSFIGGASLSDYVLDGLHLNPASLSLRGVLAYGGGYTEGEVSETSELKAFHGWIVDSLHGSANTAELFEKRSELMSFRGFPLAAALTYFDSEIEGGGSALENKTYNLSLAQVFKKKWLVGLSLYAFDTDLAASSSFHWTGNLGVIYQASSRLKIGLSGQRLFEAGASNKPEALDQDPSVQLGLAWRVRDFFQVFADLQHRFDSEDSYIVGAFESKVHRFSSFRLALGYDEAIEDFKLGFGLSFMGPRLQLHYGMEMDLESKSALHSVDFSLPL